MVNMRKDPESVDNAHSSKTNEDDSLKENDPRIELNWNQYLFRTNSPLVNIDRY